MERLNGSASCLRELDAEAHSRLTQPASALTAMWWDEAARFLGRRRFAAENRPCSKRSSTRTVAAGRLAGARPDQTAGVITAKGIRPVNLASPARSPANTGAEDSFLAKDTWLCNHLARRRIPLAGWRRAMTAMANHVESAVHAALNATANEPPEVKSAAVSGAAQAAASVPPPSGEAVSWLWKALVVGLLVLLAIALIGIISTVVDGKDNTSPDVLVTVFSSALTGLIGLFVTSPTQR